MDRRLFLTDTVLISSMLITNQEIKFTGQVPPLLKTPNLLCLWDFAGTAPLRSKGKFAYELVEAAGPVPLVKGGVLSGQSLDIQEGKYLKIARQEAPGLNIKGSKAELTILAWVKRQPKSNRPLECEAIAGMWNETNKKRQYALFLNIRLHQSSDQVCGHISGVGGPTPGEKWCVDVAIGQTPVLLDEWTFVAMTYDGQEIRSYRNGQFDKRESRNPYVYPAGIFDGGIDGADFTVGAVHRLGEIGNDFVGQLGGLAVLDRALPAAEIQQLHEAYRLPNADRITYLAEGLRFPEGPAFGPDGTFWAVELQGQSLVRRTREGSLIRYPVGGNPNGIAIDKQGLVWFCDAGTNAIRRFDPTTQQIETIVDSVEGVPLDKPNDLAFDSAGNLVFTCPGNSRQQPTGYVCVRTTDGVVRKIATAKYFPNGLAFSSDGQELIIAETYRHRLWKGHWNPQTAEWLDGQVWTTVKGPDGPGGPDGMAFGEDGNLYVAVYGTGKLHVINQTGAVAYTIALPGLNPTNCAFDPQGELGLVITEAETGRLIRYRTPLKGIIKT